MKSRGTNQRDENRGLDSPSTRRSRSSLPHQHNIQEVGQGLYVEALQLA